MHREQVICQGCGTQFEAHLRSRAYCSTICKILRRAAAGVLGECLVCKSVYWNEPYEAGLSREEFVKNHEACRMAVLDREGRPDDCRCVECKTRKEITTALSVPPSARKRQGRTYRKHRQLVLDRDKYMCQICWLPTDPDVSPLDDRYPTLDHISSVGLYDGNDEPDNLRTAHRWCNLMLGDDGFAREELVRASAQLKFS